MHVNDFMHYVVMLEKICGWKVYTFKKKLENVWLFR